VGFVKGVSDMSTARELRAELLRLRMVPSPLPGDGHGCTYRMADDDRVTARLDMDQCCVTVWLRVDRDTSSYQGSCEDAGSLEGVITGAVADATRQATATAALWEVSRTWGRRG